MIIRTRWIPFEASKHPELNGVKKNERLLSVTFIEDSTMQALTQRALKMRSREMFEEPYDPPEYLADTF
jgi:hypothetical protein